jgi:hypothetical protein
MQLSDRYFTATPHWYRVLQREAARAMCPRTCICILCKPLAILLPWPTMSCSDLHNIKASDRQSFNNVTSITTKQTTNVKRAKSVSRNNNTQLVLLRRSLSTICAVEEVNEVDVLSTHDTQSTISDSTNTSTAELQMYNTIGTQTERDFYLSSMRTLLQNPITMTIAIANYPDIVRDYLLNNKKI